MKLFPLFVFLIFFSLIQMLEASETNKLKVNGHSTLHKPADKLAMKIGVVTFDKNADLAIKANNEKMQNVLTSIKKTGLTEKEYQTGSFTMGPKYSPPPKEVPPDWRPTIIRYEVRNTLSIHTGKLELAGSIIDAAAKEGANLFEEISFSLQDNQSAESEAIVKAVQQANVYAEAAAQEAGVDLGDVLELAINPSAVTPRFLEAANFKASSESSTPISAGDVEITASVSIVYEIRHQ